MDQMWLWSGLDTMIWWMLRLELKSIKDISVPKDISRNGHKINVFSDPQLIVFGKIVKFH